MVSHHEPSSEMYERERIVFECIKNNPELHHNGLIKKIVPEFMAKTTFEKTRDSLLDKDIITVAKKGNMKFYLPTENYEHKSQQHIERITTNSFHDLKLQVKRLDTDFPHKDIDDKILVANTLLKNLLDTDNGFTILDAAKNPNKTLYRDEHLTIQQLINVVFETIRKDRDYEIILPAITSYLGIKMPENLQDK